jgi:hypothetical protein
MRQVRLFLLSLLRSARVYVRPLKGYGVMSMTTFSAVHALLAALLLASPL